MTALLKGLASQREIASWYVLSAVMAMLAPIGLALVAAGGRREREAPSVLLSAIMACGLASIGYWICGFAFQFGSIGLVLEEPGLAGLALEWSPLDVTWGLGWGVVGLHGFFLGGGASTPESYLLFLSHLPLMFTATLIPLLTLRGRVKSLVLWVLALFVPALLCPVVGNWAWGGGWLANLGKNLGLGHGFVDFAGAGVVNVAGACTALAVMVVFGLRRPQSPTPSEPASMPPVHLPLLALMGSWLFLLGCWAWSMGNPLYAGARISLALVALNLALAAGGGALLAALYAWFTTGHADLLMTARGLVAGTVAASAGAPFIPPQGALAVGVVAGLLLPLAVYLFDRLLRLEDPAAVLATHGVSGAWGVLSVALLADGRFGAGWNGVGPLEYLGVSGQGVAGYLVAPGFVPDWPQQLYAQLAGLVAIALFAFVLACLLFYPLARLIRAWEEAGLEVELSAAKKR